MSTVIDPRNLTSPDTSKTYDAGGNLKTSTNARGKTTSYRYDATGNLLSDGSISYTYSDRGRMVSATLGSNTVSYNHDGLDQRVQKQGPATIAA